MPGHETIGILERGRTDRGAALGRSYAATASRSRSSCRAATCEPCRAGVYRRCARHGLSDMYGFVPVDRPPGLWGGYAEYQYLAPDSLLVPVGPDLDPVTATLFNPLGAGIRWAVTVPETQPGDIVAVLGPRSAGALRPARRRRRPAPDSSWSPARALATRPDSPLAAEFGADLAVDVERRGSRRGACAARAGAARRRRRRRHREGAGRARSGGARSRAPAGRSCWRGRAARPTRRASTRTSSSTRSCACSARSASTPPPIAPRSICSRRVAFPSRVWRGQVAGFDDTPALLRAMAGEGDTPPVHAVFAPH